MVRPLTPLDGGITAKYVSGYIEPRWLL